MHDMRRLLLPLLVLGVGGCTSLLPSAVHPTHARHLVATVCPAETSAHILTASVPGRPFEALASRRGRWVFVSLMPSTAKPRFSAAGGSIGVMQRNGAQLLLKRVVPLPSVPAGMTLSHDGRLLVVAAGRYVDFVDISRLVSGAAHPILGSIRDAAAPGSVYVAISPDDRTLFVSDERAGTVTVIDLRRARRTGFHQDAILGSILTGDAPVGLAVSRDGHHLFVTSELWRSRGHGWPMDCHLPPGIGPAGPVGAGAIQVVDIARARHRPIDSVISRTPAGCSPVRAVLSPDGARLYVTARASNLVLAFDAARLVTDPASALVATVPVGTAPVGIAVVQHGRRVVVADSSRFGGRGGQDLTVIDVSKIDRGRAAVVGTIPVGAFPRELHGLPDGQGLLLTDTGSDQVELMPSACFAAVRPGS
jgi:YVTN family beta-propeller protein